MQITQRGHFHAANLEPAERERGSASKGNTSRHGSYRHTYTPRDRRMCGGRRFTWILDIEVGCALCQQNFLDDVIVPSYTVHNLHSALNAPDVRRRDGRVQAGEKSRPTAQKLHAKYHPQYSVHKPTTPMKFQRNADLVTAVRGTNG